MNYPVWYIPAPVFSPDQLKVVPQYGPMVMFAVTLVGRDSRARHRRDFTFPIRA
jgi:hypothetical protein